MVILGTSPVLLIEGLFRARAGQKVVFIDDAPAPGGAWSSTSALQCDNVEGACHLMVNYSGVYDFLANRCEIEMEIVSPQPLILHKGSLVPFNTTSQILTRSFSLAARIGLVSAIRAVELLTFNKWRFGPTKDYSISRAFQNLTKRRFCPLIGPDTRKAFRYPKGGSPRMIKHLMDTLSALSAEFIQAKAEGITIDDKNHVSVQIDTGTEISSNELVVSESASLDYIARNEEEVVFEPELNSHTALIARVSGIEPGSIGYVELPFDPLVERVADVTDFCKNPPMDSRIVLFENPGIGASGNPDPDPDAIMSYLKEKNILPEEAKVEEHVPHQINLRKGDPALLKHLRSLSSNAVTVIPSKGDFSYSIHQNRKHWEALASRAEAR